MHLSFLDKKAANLKQMVDEYETYSLQRSEKKAKEIADSNKYMESLAFAKLQYQDEQQSTGYEFVIDLSIGSLDQRMKWWTSVYYDNRKAKMFNLYLNKDKYRVRYLPALIEIMKEPIKKSGFLFGINYRKFYDRYVKS